MLDVWGLHKNNNCAFLLTTVFRFLIFQRREHDLFQRSTGSFFSLTKYLLHYVGRKLLTLFQRNKGQTIFVIANGARHLIPQSFSYFETFGCFTKFSFHHKRNDARLLLINTVYTSCFTSCCTT